LGQPCHRVFSSSIFSSTRSGFGPGLTHRAGPGFKTMHVINNLITLESPYDIILYNFAVLISYNWILDIWMLIHHWSYIKINLKRRNVRVQFLTFGGWGWGVANNLIFWFSKFYLFMPFFIGKISFFKRRIGNLTPHTFSFKFLINWFLFYFRCDVMQAWIKTRFLISKIIARNWQRKFRYFFKSLKFNSLIKKNINTNYLYKSSNQNKHKFKHELFDKIYIRSNNQI
jgi:hypothetical protein